MSAKPFWKSLLITTLLIGLGFILGCGKEELTEPEVLAAAQARMEAGNHTAATTLLESYLEENPGAFNVIETLAFTYSEAGDPAMAAFYFSRAAEVDPAQPEYLLYAAEALEQMGDYAGAADAYRQYITSRPRDASIHVKLAELNAELGNRSAALDAYLQANRVEAKGRVQVAIGRLYLASGNHAQAQTWFASAAQRDDGARQDALLGLLEVALRAERWADAETLVARIDEEFPEAVDSSSLADARRQLSAWRETQDAATAALRALNQPALPAQSEELASSETASGSQETAPTEPADEEAEDAGVPDGEAGIAASGEQAPPPDKQQMADALEDDFEDPVEPLSLFPMDEESGRGLTESEARTVSDGEQLVELGRMQLEAGDYQQAIRNFQRALARDNSDPDVWSDLSEAQYQAGEYIRAPASASEAVRRAPDDPRYVLQYLRVAQRTLPERRLIRELENARSRFPQSAAVALALARAYDNYGSRGYAGRMYREFLRLAPPNHPERGEVEALLNGG